ncbi:hypothetical protein PsAD13_05244 [Pseudovibrio sp. Ad13]|nr:hypothetical protein PsAD13_05244 [Pseudovibrio sp. Ad13]
MQAPPLLKTFECQHLAFAVNYLTSNICKMSILSAKIFVFCITRKQMSSDLRSELERNSLK